MRQQYRKWLVKIVPVLQLTESLSLEGIAQDNLVHPPCSSTLSRATSSQVLNTSKDADATTSMADLYQCLTALRVKKVFAVIQLSQYLFMSQHGDTRYCIWTCMGMARPHYTKQFWTILSQKGLPLAGRSKTSPEYGVVVCSISAYIQSSASVFSFWLHRCFVIMTVTGCPFLPPEALSTLAASGVYLSYRRLWSLHLPALCCRDSHRSAVSVRFTTKAGISSTKIISVWFWWI